MSLFRPARGSPVFTASSAFAQTNEHGFDGWLKSNPIPPERVVIW